MNKVINTRLAMMLSACIAGCFLAIHIAMLALFALNGVTPMMSFNIVSIVFYVVMLVLIRRGMCHAVMGLDGKYAALYNSQCA